MNHLQDPNLNNFQKQNLDISKNLNLNQHPTTSPTTLQDI